MAKRNEHPERYRWWLNELSFGTTTKRINKPYILEDKYSLKMYVKDAICNDYCNEDILYLI
jgi:hypothetical protein